MQSLKVMASQLETELEKEFCETKDLSNTKKTSPVKISGGFDRRVLIARYKDNQIKSRYSLTKQQLPELRSKSIVESPFEQNKT